jgi:hypothetical protein
VPGARDPVGVTVGATLACTPGLRFSAWLRQRTAGSRVWHRPLSVHGAARRACTAWQPQAEAGSGLPGPPGDRHEPATRAQGVVQSGCIGCHWQWAATLSGTVGTCPPADARWQLQSGLFLPICGPVSRAQPACARDRLEAATCQNICLTMLCYMYNPGGPTI